MCLFRLGQIILTNGACKILETCGKSPFEYLNYHSSGYWGDVRKVDWILNDHALLQNQRITSVYFINNENILSISTDSDRKYTVIGIKNRKN